MNLTRGTRIGPYVIEEHIASGGMGAVYRARDPRLERDVAVKVLVGTETPGAEGSELLRRFEQEARATAALNHPNILTVYDVGTHSGTPFLVCELLEGQTLRERLESGPLEAPLVLRLALQLARGVAAAHALKIIHRDLKPDNIFLTRDDTLKILDFGLAKLRPDTSPGPDSETLDASAPGRLIGTLAYMAPEQVRGDPVDGRVDLFAIGAVLYEMLSGRNPFRRRTGAETLAAVLHEAPAPLEASSAVPPGLARLVMHSMEKEPGGRFQTAADLAFALESLAGDVSHPAQATAQPDPAVPGDSIAVLPFADMSPARDQDHLCEGLAEELINALTHVDGLMVAARSSSF
ncbi:MAG: serine/threonine-protein kinase, partial [Vicinamibacteria bacterium]